MNKITRTLSGIKNNANLTERQNILLVQQLNI